MFCRWTNPLYTQRIHYKYYTPVPMKRIEGSYSTILYIKVIYLTNPYPHHLRERAAKVV